MPTAEDDSVKISDNKPPPPDPFSSRRITKRTRLSQTAQTHTDTCDKSIFSLGVVFWMEASRHTTNENPFGSHCRGTKTSNRLMKTDGPQTTLVTIRCVERCNNVERASRTCLHLHYHHHHLLPAHLWGTICILCIIIRSLLVLLLLLLTRKATEPLNSITTQWPDATVTTHLIHPHGAAFMPVRGL